MCLNFPSIIMYSFSVHVFMSVWSSLPQSLAFEEVLICELKSQINQTQSSVSNRLNFLIPAHLILTSCEFKVMRDCDSPLWALCVCWEPCEWMRLSTQVEKSRWVRDKKHSKVNSTCSHIDKYYLNKLILCSLACARRPAALFNLLSYCQVSFL